MSIKVPFLDYEPAMQNSMRTMVLVVFILVLVPYVHPARILAAILYPAKSHFVMYRTLLIALAERGHDVTVISHFPLKESVHNYEDLSVQGTIPTLHDNISISFVNLGNWFSFKLCWTNSVEACDVLLRHRHVARVLRASYDLVMTEVFCGDCFVPLAHRFGAPLVGLSSSVPLPWGSDRLANPDNPAFVPTYFSPHSDGAMDLWQRVVNTFKLIVYKAGELYYSEFGNDKVCQGQLGNDLPSLGSLKRKTSLIFMNTHHSISPVRPMVPGMIDIGGMHVEKPKPLPTELQDYMDSSPEGVVYFSTGTLLDPESFPEETMNAIVKVFESLPQKVLWRINPKKLSYIPKNVKALSWMPQNDVLNHRNMRLFISHCGLMGVQEAIWAGVPMLGIPFFADQHLTAHRVAYEGMGMALEFSNITQQSLNESIHELLTNKRFETRIMEVSRLFRDRPMSPLDTAVYWTEYVIRHKGGLHIQSASLDLSWYEDFLMDVGFIFSIIFILLLSLAFYFWPRSSRK